MRAFIAAVPCLLALAGSGCDDAGGGAPLTGGWIGTITCLGDTHDLSLGLLVDGSKLYGNGQTRTKGTNTNYDITGSQATVDRLLACVDSPMCSGDAECAGYLDQQGLKGKSRCSQGLCSPCYELKPQAQVLITLRDNNPGIPDPELELWRYGEKLMEGTIRKFCPDEDRRTPEVKVSKQD
jgi:hypothetical protein